MLKVGTKFHTFDELCSHLEEFQEVEQVQLWVRDSRTVIAAAKRARRKSLNPALKYAELTYSCVFGGRRPSDQAKIHSQTSAGGCPFKVRLSTSNDGQALVVKEICHEHNHERGKKLHDETKRLYKRSINRCTIRRPLPSSSLKRSASVTPLVLTNQVKCISRQPQRPSSPVSPFPHLHRHHQQQEAQLQQLLQHRFQPVIKEEPVFVPDSPEHIDSPEEDSCHSVFGNSPSNSDHYYYLPPSPISPSSSSSVKSDTEDQLEPILDLGEALEEALGNLDTMGDDQFVIPHGVDTTYNTTQTVIIGSPMNKRQRGVRPRKPSFSTGLVTARGDLLDFDFSDLMDFDVYLF